VKKLLGDYELQNKATKLARLRLLAKLPDAKGVPALCRLVRFEKSPVLSKHASVGLLELLPHDGPPQKELADKLRERLAGSSRTGAKWLFTRLRFDDDAEAALADWSKLVEEEHALLQRFPARTSAPIVAKLVRVQIQWFNKFHQTEKAMAAMHRLVDLEKGNQETLAALLDWLIEQKSWQMIDDLSVRFAPQFSGNPVLLYTVAQAQAEQGATKQAGQTAQRAFELNPGKGTSQLRMHYVTARALQQRGQLQWARREYLHVIDSGPPGSSVVVATQHLLSELLHDQAKDFEAADVLKALTAAVEKKPNATAAVGIRLPSIRSRRHFFLACHFHGKNDKTKQREHLDKALESDPTDIDVLIACYRLADQTPEYRRKILGLIHNETSRLRQQIAEDPASSTSYNQLAWLVGNTEGDLDEALKFSRKSIELNPGYGGYYDTLAHVYFAKTDYKNAFKTQTEAAELEPHSDLIARQLEVFRKKWEEPKNTQSCSSHFTGISEFPSTFGVPCSIFCCSLLCSFKSS
jgi:tetratricopeptide (TPR) repeat protein